MSILSSTRTGIYNMPINKKILLSRGWEKHEYFYVLNSPNKHSKDMSCRIYIAESKLNKKPFYIFSFDLETVLREFEMGLEDEYITVRKFANISNVNELKLIEEYCKAKKNDIYKKQRFLEKYFHEKQPLNIKVDIPQKLYEFHNNQDFSDYYLPFETTI